MRLICIVFLSCIAALAQTQLSQLRRPEPGRYPTPYLLILAGPNSIDLRPLLDWFADDERNMELFYDVTMSPIHLDVLRNFYDGTVAPVMNKRTRRVKYAAHLNPTIHRFTNAFTCWGTSNPNAIP